MRDVHRARGRGHTERRPQREEPKLTGYEAFQRESKATDAPKVTLQDALDRMGELYEFTRQLRKGSKR